MSDFEPRGCSAPDCEFMARPQSGLCFAHEQPKPVCVDCLDFENNIRDWVEDLGGNRDSAHPSAEMELLIDGIVADRKATPLAATEDEREELKRSYTEDERRKAAAAALIYLLPAQCFVGLVMAATLPFWRVVSIWSGRAKDFRH